MGVWDVVNVPDVCVCGVKRRRVSAATYSSSSESFRPVEEVNCGRVNGRERDRKLLVLPLGPVKIVRSGVQLCGTSEERIALLDERKEVGVGV